MSIDDSLREKLYASLVKSNKYIQKLQAAGTRSMLFDAYAQKIYKHGSNVVNYGQNYLGYQHGGDFDGDLKEIIDNLKIVLQSINGAITKKKELANTITQNRLLISDLQKRVSDLTAENEQLRERLTKKPTSIDTPTTKQLEEQIEQNKQLIIRLNTTINILNEKLQVANETITERNLRLATTNKELTDTREMIIADLGTTLGSLETAAQKISRLGSIVNPRPSAASVALVGGKRRRWFIANNRY